MAKRKRKKVRVTIQRWLGTYRYPKGAKGSRSRRAIGNRIFWNALRGK